MSLKIELKDIVYQPSTTLPVIGAIGAFFGVSEHVASHVAEQNQKARRGTIEVIYSDGSRERKRTGGFESGVNGFFLMLFFFGMYVIGIDFVKFYWTSELILSSPFFIAGFVGTFVIRDKHLNKGIFSPKAGTFRVLAILISIVILSFFTHEFATTRANSEDDKELLFLPLILIFVYMVAIGVVNPLLNCLRVFYALFSEEGISMLRNKSLIIAIVVSSLISFDLYQALEGDFSVIKFTFQNGFIFLKEHDIF